MSPESTDHITRLLNEAQHGNTGAADELFPLIYEHLKKQARHLMGGERVGHTLQPTALVHEAYLRLMGGKTVQWSGQSHFFFSAAEAMRRILVDHARARGGPKRGGERRRVPLNNVLDLADDEQTEAILALDEAVSRLQEESPSVADVVRLRFYAGLTVEQTAEALGISPRTVKREWTYARAVLFRALADDVR